MSGGRPRVLSVAGTDPTGGAGMQADLKAIAAHGGYGMSVATALVAQNTQGVRSVRIVDAEFVREQLDAVSDDVVVDAVKTGMLGSADVVEAVAEWLRAHRPPFVVVDPVMVATSGDRLLDPDAERAVLELVRLADLVTPNRDELAVLAGLVGDVEVGGDVGAGREAVVAAHRVARALDVLVLAKGGHDGGPTSDDVLVSPDGSERVFRAPRIDTENTHGTGCSLSSAIATLVAAHGDWEVAVGEAKAWLTDALRAADALEVGRGHGPVDHLVGQPDGATPTDAWWRDAAPTLEAIASGPFVRGLAIGSLDADRFAGYLAQDRLYLRAYERHLTALAASDPDAEGRAFWAEAAQGCREEAATLHDHRLRGGDAHTGAGATEHEVCAGYLDHLRTAAEDAATTRSPAVLAAAVLPCFRVYAWVGTRLGPADDAHPYADWIGAYSDPGFAAASDAATEHVARLARAASVPERGAMARVFRQSVAWEAAFFDMPFRRTGRMPFRRTG